MLAPILLVVLRLIQGFALGGEWGGAVLIVSEHGDPARRGYWASWPQAGAPGRPAARQRPARPCWPASQSEEAFLAWGWRIPFLLSAVLVLIGLCDPAGRRGVAGVQGRRRRTPPKQAAAGVKESMPILEVFRRYPREVLTAMGARFAENVSYYIFTIVITTYADQARSACPARSRSAPC